MGCGELQGAVGVCKASGMGAGEGAGTVQGRAGILDHLREPRKLSERAPWSVLVHVPEALPARFWPRGGGREGPLEICSRDEPSATLTWASETAGTSLE